MSKDKQSADGVIEELKGERGKWALNAEHDYVIKNITKPRRAATREAQIGQERDEQRAANVAGSILERIVYQRLSIIWGQPGVDFIYKYDLAAAEGTKDARAFVGGIEMDFVILSRPSNRELALEVQGAHWHGYLDGAVFADTERALIIMASGRDFSEVWEHEIALGDEYLDRRLLDLIGRTARTEREQTNREIETFLRELPKAARR